MWLLRLEENQVKAAAIYQDALRGESSKAVFWFEPAGPDSIRNKRPRESGESAL